MKPDPRPRRLWRDLTESALHWAFLVVTAPVVSTVYGLAVLLDPAGRPARWIEGSYARLVLAALGITPRVDGLDRVPEGSFVLMANHQSVYDIPLIHALFGRDRDLRWIGKKEARRIPFLGWVYALGRHVKIDRKDPGQAIGAMRRAVERRPAGVSFVVLPEGTRSPDGRLLPFKKGGFHLAIDSGLPILPVSIEGTGGLMPKGTGWLRSGEVRVGVLPAVATRPVDGEGVDRLRSLVRDRIAGVGTRALEGGS